MSSVAVGFGTGFVVAAAFISNGTMVTSWMPAGSFMTVSVVFT